MKNFILIPLLLLSLTGVSQSWKYMRHEVTFGLGTSHFLGELGGANDIGSSGIKGFKDLEFKLTRPTVAAGYRFYVSPMFALKADLSYGRLNGDDALTTEIFRQNRNLSFRSPVIELAGRVEFYPLREYFGHLYRTNGVVGKKVNHFSPYIFLGVGGAWFNPKAEYDGKWVALKPLQTEGVDYKRIMAVFPMGVGVKYAISNQLSIGLEIGLRYTTSDYVDDVSDLYIDHSASDAMTQYLADPSLDLVHSYVDGSYVYNPTAPGMQRGDPSDKDAYVFTLITANYKFMKGKLNLPKF
ncbi:MAG: outer membrane beta-barrel protein [Flavobacteriales bacterium]|nr:outer membrane beta-barrel protein [Flavobacteriales bacterium]